MYDLNPIKEAMAKAKTIGVSFKIPDCYESNVPAETRNEICINNASREFGRIFARDFCRHDCTYVEHTECSEPPLETEHRFEGVVIHPHQWQELNERIRDLETALRIQSDAENRVTL